MSRQRGRRAGRLYRRAIRLERGLAARDDLEQLWVALGLFAIGASGIGVLTLPFLSGFDRAAALALLLAAGVAGALLVARPRPAAPAPLLTTGAIAAQTSYVVLTGGGDSPFLPGFLLIVVLIGVFSPPGRTFWAACLASAGLLVSAIADMRLDSGELLTVVTTSVGILVAGTILSWLAWRRRVWLRHLSRRASRGRAIVARRTAESRTDPLTGVGNRRVFDENLRARVAAGEASSIGLLFADADNLKAVNDSLGHDAGDEVLRAIADMFARSLRAREHVYRIGGDEFVAIVEAADVAGLTERLGSRLDVEARDVGAVSASIGAIRGRPDDTADELLRRADRAMYRSKRDRDPGAA